MLEYRILLYLAFVKFRFYPGNDELTYHWKIKKSLICLGSHFILHIGAI